ncbi:MAG: hypothetical protein ACPLRH_00995 [Desulfotomaculales bacterium]
MINVFTLVFLLAVTFHLCTYARWSWTQGYRRGAVGTFFIAFLTLFLPVAVWVYHQYGRWVD